VDDRFRLYTATGVLMTDNVIFRMAQGLRIDVAFVESMYSAAIRLERDVFYLEHASLDYSNFVGRMTVAALYGVGFALLLIPTITTTWQILF
jgi:hypothetical protein